MTYDEIFNKAKEIIGKENIDDYRPAVFSAEPDTMLDGVEQCVPNTINIWLKNGDVIWYRAKES